MSRSVNKSVPQGQELLLARREWCAPKDIQGRDPDVLNAPILELAFERILERFKPTRDIALVSLCTSTRPYSNSRKWSAYRTLFGAQADLIICSNGGIIPIVYETSFPFLNYDAHGEAQFDALYIKVVSRRLWAFFTTHRYRFVLFNFRHNMRNVHSAREVGSRLKAEGYVEDFAILPSQEHYEASQRAGFARTQYMRVPELYPLMLNPVRVQINQWARTSALQLRPSA